MPQPRFQPRSATPQNLRVATANLLYKAQQTALNRTTTPQQRAETCYNMNSNMQLLEMMVANMVQLYIDRVKSRSQELGLYRHQLKKSVRQMESLGVILIKECNYFDTAFLHEILGPRFAPLVDDYIEAGGSLVSRMQVAYLEKHRPVMTQMYYCTKNALDHLRLPHSDMLTDLLLITMLARTCVEMYAALAQKMQKVLGAFKPVPVDKSRWSDKLLNCASQLCTYMKLDNVELPEREYNEARQACKNFHRAAMDDWGTLTNGIADAMTMHYVEFVLATLRIRLAEGTVGLPLLRELFHRLASKDNVRRLLDELESTVPYSPADGKDAFDLAEELPSGPEMPGDKPGDKAMRQAPLATFRRILMMGGQLVPNESPELIRHRELRQEARSNGGSLPTGTLQQLYKELKTKKAVVALLQDAGLPEVAKEVKGMKAAELKDEN